jgi:hypothetical protein
LILMGEDVLARKSRDAFPDLATHGFVPPVDPGAEENASVTSEAFVAVASGLAMVKAKTVLGAVRLSLASRTFATVGWPDLGWAVVKLSSDDQKRLVGQSIALAPEPGRRGKQGVTLVRLSTLDETTARQVLEAGARLAAGELRVAA